MAEESEVPRKKRSRRLLWGVLGTLLALVLIVGGAIAYYGKAAVDALNEVQRDPSMMPTGQRPEPLTGENVPVNFVLMGSDARGEEQGRSDVLQVLHISGDRSKLFLMSIPRDSWVDVPGHGEAKVNAAYAWGGAALTVETVESMLDVPIDHTAIIDFEGFVKVIDALGGVSVYNSEASSTHGFDYPEGMIDLTGESALWYVRERKSLSNGDFGRADRQREVLKAIVAKLASGGVLGDPGKFRESVTTLGQNFTVDAGLTNDVIIDLGWQMRNVSASSIETFQLPTAGFGTSSDGQSIVLVDEDKLAELRTALRDDSLSEFVATLE